MFKLLRYFSISSALAIGLMTLMVGLLYKTYENSRLLNRTELQNVADANLLLDAVRARHGKFLADADATKGDDLKLRWEVTDIDLMSRQLFLRKPIVEIELLDHHGRTLYGSRLEKVGKEMPTAQWGKLIGSTRKPTSYMTTVKRFVGLTGFVANADLVRSHVTIAGDTPATTYVVAIARDVTAQKARIDHDVAVVTMFTVVLCSILYLVLFLIIARADRIILAQYNQISTFSTRLEAEVEDRTRSISNRHEAIAELMKSATVRSGTAREAADEILRVTAKVLAVDRVSIGLLTEQGEKCQILDHIDLRTGERYSGLAPKEVLVQNEIGFDTIYDIHAIADVQAEPGLPAGIIRHANKIGIRAIMNVPIHINGKFGGALAIRDCRGPRRWSADDRLFATSLANLVSLVIEREDGHRARERIAQDARHLVESQIALSALLENESFRSGSVQTALGSLTHTVVNVLGLDLATIWLFSEDRTAFHNAETYLRPKNAHTSSTLYLKVDIARQLVNRILSNEVFAIEDMSTDPAIVEVAKTYKTAVWSKSTIWAPIVHNGRVVGALSAGTIHSHASWTAHERLLVAAVATMVSIILERAERERVELDLRAANDIAKQASEAKSLFLANMSHEIRTPMNGVFGMAEILAQSPLDQRQRRQVATIQQSARTLLKIINDILDLSRIEAGKFELDYQPLDIRRAIEGAVDLFQDQFRIKGLDLIVFIATDIPQLVMGDETRLKQVAMNLIGNALKFTERGQVAVRVLSSQRADQAVDIHVSVSDTGIGIEPSVAETLFQPFAQADSSITRRFGGTGLGLSISRYLVELMGGDIQIESAVGRGTTVNFVLPMQPIAIDATARREFGGRLIGRRVLVVDDRDANREIVASYLQSAGVDVSSARSAKEAFGILRAAHRSGRPYHAAIIDIVMPEENGMDFIKRLRASAHGKALPLVVVTSSGQDGIARTARENGVEAFLTKPIRREELIDAVEQSTMPKATQSQPLPIVARERPNYAIHALVAEDNPVNEEVMREFLALYGISIDVARNGREAVEAYQRKPFDLIFMDCQMPEMDGFSATRAIRDHEQRTRTPRTPIIAVTANAYDQDRHACLEAGMDGYLSKPFNERELARTLNDYAANKKKTSTQTDDGAADNVRNAQPPTQAPPAPMALQDAQPHASVLDPNLVTELRQKHPRLFEKLITTYQLHAPKVMQDAVTAIENGNVSALHLAAHSLKSSSANVGATAVADVSRALEALAKASSIVEAEHLKHELQQAFDAAQASLNVELAALKRNRSKPA